jgi:Fur family ferric uptake transcriptional regulator
LENNDLKRAGLKVTAPRVKILQLLETAGRRHLSAEEIYTTLRESNEDIGLATVYRVLTQFEAAGLVIKHHFEGGQAVFELDEGEHHDHMVCVKCNKVKEFVDPVIEERQIEIAKKMNFQITDHSLYIYGICQDCISQSYTQSE